MEKVDSTAILFFTKIRFTIHFLVCGMTLNYSPTHNRVFSCLSITLFLSLPLFLISSSVFAQPSITPTQSETESQSETDAISDLKSVPQLEQIREVERKVKEAVARVLPATVCITDGISIGSGVVIDEKGTILTAGHVLTTKGKRFRVIFPDGREVSAERLGKNLSVDAGMCRITDEGDWPFVPLGETDSVERGDWCFGLGHSGGYELGRTPPIRIGRILNTNERRIVSDCALIGGDSGGPLFDPEGNLIAIHSSIGTSIAENRHVTIGVFKEHWDRMLAGETWGELTELSKARPNGPLLGIRLNKQLDDVAEVIRVRRGTPAFRAGIQEGDRIESIDGETIIDWQHLIDIISDHEPDDVVKFKIRRAGKIVDATIRLARRDENE